ncbi:aminoglycoside adenylyltransferase domain-containing protein [Deinococcus apachensis]|uniref:aminoglycoside adenylyltransferase domain-containing protein n=1 Tax=Deinococcus apachensis TaxID=309886 RepID=UPI00146B3734|nr:aminoglycoside adenylyltransferase domain-containing protein [Deinococcus apachensis]
MDGPTSFPELNGILASYVEGARRVLGPNFVGAYLTGSFALGDADAGSDVDFLIVVRELLGEEQAQDVQTMHREVYDRPSHWAKHLEGSYFPADLLRRPDPARTPVPYFDHGSRDLQFSDHDNTLVVRWVTREHGLALAGPPPRELIDPVNPDDLRAEVRTILNQWGRALLGESEDTSRGWAWTPDGLDNDWLQPLVVLLMTRMLQTLDTGAVYSKKAAVAWAERHAPEWAPLLGRAWAKHADQFTRYQRPADPQDLALTRDFIRFALNHPLALMPDA